MFTKFRVGCAFTIFSVLMLPGVLLRAVPGFAIDYPCETGLGPQPSAGPNINITYCISWWPRNASGGGVAASGISSAGAITINPQGMFGNPVAIERTGQNLKGNGHILQPGDKLNQTYWIPSINPWLLLTSDVTIVNRGILMPVAGGAQDSAGNTIYLSGDVRESWALNPLGLVLLIVGIGLIASPSLSHPSSNGVSN